MPDDTSKMPEPANPAHQRGRTFLREWRKRAQLSQEKAAERAGMSRTNLGRIEKGEIPYNQDWLEKLAIVYGCHAADLLAVDPSRPQETDVVKLFRKASPEVKKIVETILKAS